MSEIQTRRFSVVVPTEDSADAQLSQVRVDDGGLTITKVPGEEVLETLSFDVIQGWWLDSEKQLCIVVANGNEKTETREIKIRSKRSQDIIDAMHETVGALLSRRQTLMSTKTPSAKRGEGGGGGGGGGRGGSFVGVSSGLRKETMNSDELLDGKGIKGANTSTVVVKAGTLKKRREKLPYNWKERYFLLERSVGSGSYTLTWWENKQTSQDSSLAKGSVAIATMTELVKDIHGPLVSFQAFQTNKSRARFVLLKASNDVERNEWFSALRECIFKAHVPEEEKV